MEKKYLLYLYFPNSFPPQGQEEIIFSVTGKREKKRVYEADTTVVAVFHLVKQLSVVRF